MEANRKSNKRDDLVAIAKVARPKGLKGEVIADLLTDFPDRFENLERVLVGENGERQLRLERFSFQKDRIVLKFEGINDIENAESLRDCLIFVPESEAVDLEEGEYFDWQLEGCNVVTKDGEPVGEVKGIFRAGENINLVVQGDEREHMIPFVEAICTEVDIETGEISVDLPEGLLEF